jgi:hypothetical protein
MLDKTNQTETLMNKVVKYASYPSPSAELGFRTGTGKPAVLLKRVRRVRVRYRFLAHRDTPRTRAAVSRVPTGLLW